MLPPNVLARLDERVSRFAQIEEALAAPEVYGDPGRLQRLAKQHSELEALVRLYEEYQGLCRRLDDATRILVEEGDDPELCALAQDDERELRARIPQVEDQLRLGLLPRDPLDTKSTVVEIRAGTGGDEASLFAGDLFRLYSRYADNHGYRLEVLSTHPTEVGGFKEVIFLLKGEGVYGRIKYEAGVHRVQRVPVTEAQGRIHTSTVTVSVLPEPEDVDVRINESTDLKVDTFASSGPGGQSVNTTNSAVRITHLPTGLVVTCQDERSQLKNKAKALKVLRFKLLQVQREAAQAERAQERRSQIGTGERAEKIRTYNFPQGRFTDHRINLTIHRLPEVMQGDIDEVVDALILADQERRLEELAV